MVAVKRIDAATWASLPDDDVAETDDLYAERGAGTYRYVRADLASVTIPALTAGTIDQATPSIGDTLTVSGAVVGSTPVYRWQKSATNAFAGEETDIAGATGSSLDTASGVTADDYVRRGVQDEGPQSEVFTAAVQVGAAATAPAQMDAPSLAVDSTSQITATLASAPDNGGSAITQYDLRWQPDGGAWTEVLDVTSPVAISGLDADTLYYVQTRAVNAVGAGAWSASASDTTQAAAGGITDPTEVGAVIWLDGTDWAYQKQDLSGTTAITAAGQNISYFVDRSGNGNDFNRRGSDPQAISASGHISPNGFVIEPASTLTGLTEDMEVYVLMKTANDYATLLGISLDQAKSFGPWQDGSSSDPVAGFTTSSAFAFSVNESDLTDPDRNALQDAWAVDTYVVASGRGVNLDAVSEPFAADRLLPLAYNGAVYRLDTGEVKHFILTPELTIQQRSDLIDWLKAEGGIS